MPVVLYDIKQRVTLIQRAAGPYPVTYWDRSMDLDNADFRIYKGVDNKIEFLIRNTDRKAVPLMGGTVQIVFTDRTTGEVIASPMATVVDELLGSLTLTLSASLTQDWPEGAIRYSALHQDVEGNQFLLFADQNQRATAYCYVMQSPIQAPPSPEAPVYNFPTLKSNETVLRRLQIASTASGPMDLTGYAFRMQIRSSRVVDPNDVLQTLTSDGTDGDINVIIEGDNVYLELRIGPFPQITARVIAYYDLVAIKDGNQNVWLEGTIPLEPGVTI